MGPLGDWYSLTRHEYCTLRNLIGLWEEGHVAQTDDVEEDPDKVMLDLALEVCADINGVKTSSGKVTKLKDVGLFNRSRIFPPISAVSGDSDGSLPHKTV